LLLFHILNVDLLKSTALGPRTRLAM